MFARTDRRYLVLCSAVSLVHLAGCGQEPQIRSYEVPRDADAALSDPAGAEATPTRMIAAIVPRESEAWFVKTTGPEEAMDEVAADLQAFIAEIAPVSDDPNAIRWEAPSEWKDGGQRIMREATFVLPEGDPPLEVAISKLGYDGDLDAYLLDNINRWRGQIGLPPVNELDETSGVSEVELDGGTAWVFDAVGTLSGGAMRPPMIGAHPPFAGGTATTPSPTPPPTRAAKPVLQFEKPDNWQEQARGSMGSRNFQVGSGDELVTVKLSDFPPVGAMPEPLANINRWRGQLEQPPLDTQSIKEHTEAVEIAGADGVLTTITRPDESEAMLAAMVVKLDHVWFFQMIGTPAAVEQNRDSFVDWLGTVEITDGAKEDE